jgi:hypothetical protein
MGAARRLCCRFEKIARNSPASSPRRIPERAEGYRVTMGNQPVQLSDEQLAELQRWADGLMKKGAEGELELFARAIGPLGDEVARVRAGRPDPGANGIEVASLRRRAESVVENGAPEQVRAAARAVLLLCDDIANERRMVRVARVRRRRRAALLAVGGVACAGIVALIVTGGGTSALDATGPASAFVGKEALSTLAFTVEGDEGDLAATTWKLDGESVDGRVTVADDRLVYRPGRLADGKHTVEVSRGSGLFGESRASWTFAVDTRPPAIHVTKGSLTASRGDSYTLRGAVDPGARLRVNGSLTPLDERGRFAVPFPTAPRRTVVLVARDEAGNATDSRLEVGTAPRLPRNPVRAVHVSADAWAHAGLRAGVLSLLAERKINAVELDIKDELGIVGWHSGVPLARRIGAERDTYDLAAAVRLLHARGARVIGRLVAFRDPVLAEWAWTHGRREFVVQTPSGGAYSGGYGGFTNYAHDDVQKYNVDLAVAAARLGVDDVLYDYVRRPDGPLESMVAPGLEGDPDDAIVRFLGRARQRLRQSDAFLGASVFGVAATRPDEIAQNVPSMAREVDYIAPMVYPSHWGPEEYGVANPAKEPYAIVRRSLLDFRRAVRGSGARVVPWLQDFSLGVDYGEREVRAQIDATRAAGINEYLLWDPRVTYTDAALKPTAPLPTVGSRDSAPGSQQLVKLPASRSPDDPVRSGLQPNELGVVPVIMYHQLLPDGGAEYDVTPAEFRAELLRLYREHYRPVTASAYVSGKIDLPRGASPVVLTFDDSAKSQAALLEDGRIDPQSAVGIMLEFARAHPDFRPAGTFYVNRLPFGDDPRAEELARKLVSLGFELGNHTFDHARLDELTDEDVQREIVLGNRLIRDLVPGADIATIALPYGLLPVNRGLALEGAWDGERYRFAGAFLAGAEPSPSPFADDFDSREIPRIRTDPRDLLNGSSDWLKRLDADPELRYVSDGRRSTPRR